MTNANDGWAPSTGEIERIKQLFADAFGPDVLQELPLRLDLLRDRPQPHARDWNRFKPAPPASRA